MKSVKATASDNTADEEKAVDRFIRKLGALLTVKHSLRILTAWCFLWGTLALALRVATDVSVKRLLWGAAGAVFAFIAGAAIARRRMPARGSIRSLLDRENDCGGLLMVSGEASLGEWRSRVSALRSPELKWRGSKSIWLFASSIVFAVACLLAPLRPASSAESRGLEVGREVADLAQKIDALKEEKVIDGLKAETLENRLEQLASEATGEDPAKTWEALDTMAESLEKTVKEAAEAGAEQKRKMEMAEALAEGLAAGGEQLDAQLMTEAMKTLSEMSSNAMKENEALAGQIPAELQQAIKSGSLSPDQLKELAKALGANKAALDQKLAKLNQIAAQGKNRSIDPNSLKSAKAGKRDNSGLTEFLKENAKRGSVDDAVEAWCSGRGGVDRGRGDAEMTWTDGSSEKNAKFKEKVLPPSAIESLKDSRLVGLSQAAPSVESSVTAHGTLNNASVGGGSAYTQTILPRHKGAVKRYFDRERKK